MHLFKKSRLVTMIVVMSAISPLSVFAGEAGGHGQIPFAAFDKDRNGWVSKQEFNQVRAQMMAKSHGASAKGIPSFSDFDKNGDGKLSESELSAGH